MKLFERFYAIIDMGFHPIDAYDMVTSEGRWDLLDLTRLSDLVVRLSADTITYPASLRLGERGKDDHGKDYH